MGDRGNMIDEHFSTWQVVEVFYAGPSAFVDICITIYTGLFKVIISSNWSSITSPINGKNQNYLASAIEVSVLARSGQEVGSSLTCR